MYIILSFSVSIAEEKKKEAKREGQFDTTSKELKEKYQRVNASIFATMITAEEYPGPFAGPGFYAGMNGPLVSIIWLEKNKSERGKVGAERHIPIGSVLSADHPFHLEKGSRRYIVYYKGPFGETEFFILVDRRNENEKSSIYEKFIERWKLYLLSQEPNK